MSTLHSKIKMALLLLGMSLAFTGCGGGGGTTTTTPDATASFKIDTISNASIAENSIYTSVTPAITGDTPIGVITYSLAGTDADVFEINSTTGVLTMAAQDFETPADANTDNVYELNVTASDADDNTATTTWTVTVTDVKETASFTIDTISNASIAENSIYTSVRPAITGTPIGAITYSLAGTDADVFEINSTTGVLTMAEKNVETPADANKDNV